MDGLDAIMAELSGKSTPNTTATRDNTTGAATTNATRRKRTTVTASPTNNISGVVSAPAMERGNRVTPTRTEHAAVHDGPDAGRNDGGGPHQQSALPSTMTQQTLNRRRRLPLSVNPPELAQRTRYFEGKLKHFALNLADPKSRHVTNAALAREPFDEFVDYYRQNPKLAKYTVKQDLQRLDYRVIPHGRFALMMALHSAMLLVLVFVRGGCDVCRSLVLSSTHKITSCRSSHCLGRLTAAQLHASLNCVGWLIGWLVA